jgi:hypothetical protein
VQRTVADPAATSILVRSDPPSKVRTACRLTSTPVSPSRDASRSTSSATAAPISVVSLTLLLTWARRRAGKGSDLQGVVGHGQPSLDRSESSPHLGQPRGVGVDLLRQLGMATAKQITQLLGRDLLVEDLPALREAEAELLQRHQRIHAADLRCRVPAVARVVLDPDGGDEPELVVVTQHPDRHAGVTSEISDAQHGGHHPTP